MLTYEMERRLMECLKDDIGGGDATAAITPPRECRAEIRANEPCTVAGVEEISFILKKLGLSVRAHKKDGQEARKGERILEISGQNRKILSAERVCLNILGRMSGVAAMCTRAKKIAGKETIAATRKTAPGFQMFDKKAAEMAGAWTHRKNLAEMILLKDNHLKFFGDAGAAARKAKETGKKFEIEVKSEEDALAAAAHSPDIIMLDNFSHDMAKKTAKKLRKEGFAGKIELSGGIVQANLKKYTGIGADIISMGELTKKARIIDFGLEIIEVKK